MVGVEAIERAIEGLAPEDFRRVAVWVREREQLMWDRQIDRDSASGALDSLFEEGDIEVRNGLARGWPSPE